MKYILHLIDDEKIIHDIFKRIFKNDPVQLIISENHSQALSQHTDQVDVVVLDLMIPGSSGLEIFKDLKKLDDTVQVIFLTAYGTIETAIEAMRLGAVDYMQKPFNNEEIKHRIFRIIKEKETIRENRVLKKTLGERYGFPSIIGKSREFRKVLDMVESVAPTNSTILVSGESGTGKELIAKAIYQNSNRRHKPFLSFNSSNIPSALFESLLFGYKKGSFTGAYSDKKGIFEEADGGTIFFDEIANIDAQTQAKILRVLQEKEIQPLGSNRSVKVDVRIICATNVSLKNLVDQGQFREDLYYRLNIINIHLPPLRDRKDDIPELMTHFIEKYSRENGKTMQPPSPEMMSKLMDYPWPGNIRELENAMQRSVVLSVDGSLPPALLPEEIRNGDQRIHQQGSFNDKVDDYRKALIRAALDEYNWVQKKAAQALEIKPTTLSELMKRLGINR
jgi:two-component system response regulator PilR (NtrC family)